MLLVLVAACGSSDGSGEMVLGGSLTGEANGSTFSGKFGFAGTHDGKPIIAIGEANLDCGADPAHSEVHGIGAMVTNFSYDMTVAQPDAFVEVFRYQGTQYSLGGSDGVLTLTEVTPDTVAGTVDFDYAAGSGGDSYSAHGDFILTRCP
jgi:hypothetical protein